jgi:hypothetical protein
MNTQLLLTLSLLLSVTDQHQIATNQTLSKIYQTLDLDPSKKYLLRLLPLLTPKQRDWMKNLF